MSSSILLSIIIITLLILTICCQSKNNNVTFGCVPSEKKTLMRFKASFTYDPFNIRLLSSWKNNTDCCSWAGVKCDNATGHVVELHLRNRYSIDEDAYFKWPNGRLTSDTIDSSLLELKYLRYLDMSGVNLSRTKNLIKVLGILPSSLVDLRLSGSQLDDTNLPQDNCVNKSGLLFTNVQHLDLSLNSFGDNSSFCFLSNMTSLSFLDLSSNSFYQNSDWVSDFLWDKCHLKSLSVNSNQFYGDISGAFRNLSGCWGHNLESLDLGGNEFHGRLPEELGELKQLREFDVSKNTLFGPIPSSIGNLKALRLLDLSNNQLGGEIPVSLGQLSNLERIVVENNKLSGPIPSSIGNLRVLRVLVLSDNQLGGEIPVSLGQLSNLETIFVSDKLSGPIPSSIGNLKALRLLDLSNNQLGGEIPVSLGQLSNLERINMYNNSLEGTLSEAHFAKLSRLESFNIYFNNGIKFNVGDDWVPPFQKLKYLYMGSVEIIGSKFPQWLKTQKSLQELYLYNCSIRGTLPTWLGSLMNLTDLDLSYSNIHGPIPELPSNMEMLNLARNLINGSIPESFCQMKDLRQLDLSRNHISGHLPDCNWMNLYSAKLSYNQLSGAIPNYIGRGGQLTLLQLSNNGFTGNIPFTLMNCTFLHFLDVGDNKLFGNLPHWIGNHLLNLRVLSLRNNKFYGEVPSSYCKLSVLQVMDLAHNHLTGNIPRCFGNLSGMINSAIDDSGYIEDQGLGLSEMMKGVMLEYTMTLRYLVNLDLSSNRFFGEIPSELMNLIALKGLNFSHNHLGGTIPGKIGDMKLLESLDLSCNNLSGTIPGSLSKLNYLSYLNFSNNHLSGPIPTGPQLQTLKNPSSYDGNPGLCGDPLSKKCRIINNEIPQHTRKVENEDGGMKDKIYLYAFITSGVATGFWGYFGVLVIKRSWRLALFRSMDVVIGKMLGRY